MRFANPQTAAKKSPAPANRVLEVGAASACWALSLPASAVPNNVLRLRAEPHQPAPGIEAHHALKTRCIPGIRTRAITPVGGPITFFRTGKTSYRPRLIERGRKARPITRWKANRLRRHHRRIRATFLLMDGRRVPRGSFCPSRPVFHPPLSVVETHAKITGEASVAASAHAYY